MVEIEEAIRIVDEQQFSMQVIDLGPAAALNYCLARNIISDSDIPAFDNSSVDGYALSGEFENYSIVTEVAAGETSFTELMPGQAARIFTGAAVPPGTSSVIMQEQVKRSGHQLSIEKAPLTGSNIRKRGKEIQKGDLVFPVGHRLTAASLGFISSLGITSLQVFKKPRIAILATGNELLEPGTPKRPGQIYESSRITLTAALNNYGFEVATTRLVKDDPKLISKTINELLTASDLLFITGGISVGDYDFVYQALKENEVEELFYKVRQKPGKPLFFGRKREKFVFALPGNPASSLTCFYVYGLTLAQRLSGWMSPGLLRVSLPLATVYELKTDRPSFLKASITEGQITIRDGQESAMIKSLGDANALVFMPGSAKLDAGSLVETLIL